MICQRSRGRLLKAHAKQTAKMIASEMMNNSIVISAPPESGKKN
jgi:hypothetical protein